MTTTDASQITADGEPYMVFDAKTNVVVGQNLSAADATKLLSEAVSCDQLIALPLIEWATLAHAAGA